MGVNIVARTKRTRATIAPIIDLKKIFLIGDSLVNLRTSKVLARRMLRFEALLLIRGLEGALAFLATGLIFDLTVFPLALGTGLE
jgi:hypothetical protein